MKGYRVFALPGMSLLALATPAFAQEEVPAGEQERCNRVVATGTLYATTHDRQGHQRHTPIP